MSFVYPVDVNQLVKAVDTQTAAHLHLSEAERDDQRLTAVVWGVGHGWFPLDSKRHPHHGVDIGVPNAHGTGGMFGAPVMAIGQGEVLLAESGTYSVEGFPLSRVIIRHPTASGDVFALYQRLDALDVGKGGTVEAGQKIGTIGWHGDFPHLHFAAVSTKALGGRALEPEALGSALPADDTVWDVLRMSMPFPDWAEWPVLNGPVFVYNPIELVRFLKKDLYLPDVSSGHLSRVELAHDHKTFDVQKDVDAEVKHPVLHSKLLAAVDELVTAASDPLGFAGIGKGHGNADTVKAIQQALKKAGHGTGRTLGTFNDDVVWWVQQFQKALSKKKTFLEGYGLDAAAVKLHGKIDWLTLVALDACLALLEKDKPADAPAPAAPADSPAPDAGATAEVPRPPPPEAPKNLGPDHWVFDGRNAAGKSRPRQSMEFGVRLYEALRTWHLRVENGKLVGTRYSTDSPMDAFEVYHAPYMDLLKPEKEPWKVTEWPDLSSFQFIEKHKVRYAAGKDGNADVHKYDLISCRWAATGYTNCCNSQVAAFYVAARGPDVVVQKKDTETIGFFLGRDDRKDRKLVVKNDGGKVTYVEPTDEVEKKRVRAAELFRLSVCLVDPTAYDTTKGGGLNGCIVLGVGDAIPMQIKGKDYDGTFTDSRQVLRGALIGDWSNTDSHAWLVGEVRYAVTFKGSKKVDAYCDQSSFCDPDGGKKGVKWEKPVLMSKQPKSTLARLLNDDELEWLTKNEDAFKEHLNAFLNAQGPIAMLLDNEPVTKEIDKIEIASAGVFTANCVWNKDFSGPNTLRGRHCQMKKEHQQKVGPLKKELADLAKQMAEAEKPLKKKPPTATDDDKKKFADAKKACDDKQAELSALLYAKDHWTEEGADVDETKDFSIRGITNLLREPPLIGKISVARFYARAPEGS
jgi:hypothetical protein